MVVALHHRLAALLGPLAHRLAGLDGLVLEVDGADGGVHGTQEEEQVRTATGSWRGQGDTDGCVTAGDRSVKRVLVQPSGRVVGRTLSMGSSSKRSSPTVISVITPGCGQRRNM